MIGWFSLNVPSGLGLYWLVNNIVTTSTTVLIRNQVPAAPLPSSRAAKRAEPLDTTSHRRSLIPPPPPTHHPLFYPLTSLAVTLQVGTPEMAGGAPAPATIDPPKSTGFGRRYGEIVESTDASTGTKVRFVTDVTDVTV